MIDRATAYDLMVSKIKNRNLQKHILSVEAGMIKLAQHFGEDVEKWGLVGLLHDLDYDKTAKDPDRHTFVTEEWLRNIICPMT